MNLKKIIAYPKYILSTPPRLLRQPHQAPPTPHTPSKPDNPAALLGSPLFGVPLPSSDAATSDLMTPVLKFVHQLGSQLVTTNKSVPRALDTTYHSLKTTWLPKLSSNPIPDPLFWSIVEQSVLHACRQFLSVETIPLITQDIVQRLMTTPAIFSIELVQKAIANCKTSDFDNPSIFSWKIPEPLIRFFQQFRLHICNLLRAEDDTTIARHLRFYPPIEDQFLTITSLYKCATAWLHQANGGPKLTAAANKTRLGIFAAIFFNADGTPKFTDPLIIHPDRGRKNSTELYRAQIIQKIALQLKTHLISIGVISAKGTVVDLTQLIKLDAIYKSKNGRAQKYNGADIRKELEGILKGRQQLLETRAQVIAYYKDYPDNQFTQTFAAILKRLLHEHQTPRKSVLPATVIAPITRPDDLLAYIHLFNRNIFHVIQNAVFLSSGEDKKRNPAISYCLSLSCAEEHTHFRIWQLNGTGVAESETVYKTGARTELIPSLGAYDAINTRIQTLIASTNRRIYPEHIKGSHVSKWIIGLLWRQEDVPFDMYSDLKSQWRMLVSHLCILLLGTECARNPATFITHYMMLELIANDQMSWNEALSAHTGEFYNRIHSTAAFTSTPMQRDGYQTFSGGCSPMSIAVSKEENSIEKVVKAARALQTELGCAYQYPGPTATSKKTSTELKRREWALINRWMAWKEFDNPTEADYKAQIQQLVDTVWLS